MLETLKEQVRIRPDATEQEHVAALVDRTRVHTNDHRLQALDDAIARAMDLITHDDIVGWFRHCTSVMSAADGVLWSFGAKDIMAFDGKKWARVDG